MNKLAWDKLIVALDLNREKEIKRIVDELSPRVKKFKVGLIAYTLLGPNIIQWLTKKKVDVFLDLKLFDIPHTMTEAVKVMTDMGVWGITVHAKSGGESLKILADSLREHADKKKLRKPLLVGVTELTSQVSSIDKVFSLAQDASIAGLEAVVCSVWEARQIKTDLSLITITPGIRAQGGDDQRRIATVADALRAQVDYFVVGRPIIQQADYMDAARRLLKST
ncbi:MAG: orotidine-5'-phosphate decarboxylase [Candidatus Omnitrophica bacterium]|nr:orotidine-5'-phosphate decarboxylase [Candidatus Omnitrophota bacterium]